MSFLQDIISSTAAGLKKEEKLVKGKKWVKRGVVKKISEKKEYEERVRKKQEAERAKRRRRELEASQQLAKKTRLQLQRTEKKIGLSNNNDGTTPATAQSAATTAEVVGEEEDAADGGSKLILPVAEVVRRLRSMGAPITLFGETDLERLKRMRKVEVEGLDDEGILHTGTHAMRNVFLKGKQHREGTDEVDDLAEFDTEGGTTTDETQLGMLGDAGVSMTGEEARAHVKKQKKKRKPDDKVSTETFVLRFFRRMLKEWANDLAARPQREKSTAEGRNRTKTQKQCKDYMRPFLKMCQTKTIEKSVLGHAKAIVDACLERNYKLALEEYMRLAIGNAPWPIGVTNVGIHERVGRENISTSKIAHVLNDEQQRKYVTSMKRLITYCQTKYPTDPSKMVG